MGFGFVSDCRVAKCKCQCKIYVNIEAFRVASLDYPRPIFGDGGIGGLWAQKSFATNPEND